MSGAESCSKSLLRSAPGEYKSCSGGSCSCASSAMEFDENSTSVPVDWDSSKCARSTECMRADGRLTPFDARHISQLALIFT